MPTFDEISVYYICSIPAKSAPPTNANCGEQSVNVVEDVRPFSIPEHDGPRECTYFFTSENDTVMSFLITRIAIGTEEGKCDNDYITIGDADKDLPHTRYTACGNKRPNWQFFSTRNQMTLKLMIRSLLNNVSVMAMVSAYSLDGDDHSICGKGIIHVGTGRTEFSSPPHGSKLKSNAICFYKLLGNNSGDENMAFSFQSFNVSDFP
ncbi:hypothetical protein D915_010886 [Fasciola hepatica]|uniref:CUB domain-containing protein n=1 Tax=Fasciola hepatica TaxID=6192 RepID=A0A4E0QTQ1_FASHE|nr:hypothetical protein D915_010886 [Fasciola hepatica]